MKLARVLWFHLAREVLRWKKPRIAAHPFFYFAEGALGTERSVKAWPCAPHFNLAGEKLFYSANARIKGPSDEFARLGVLHHTEEPFCRKFLVDRSVPPDHISPTETPPISAISPLDGAPPFTAIPILRRTSPGGSRRWPEMDASGKTCSGRTLGAPGSSAGGPVPGGASRRSRGG